jgi:hypothetical protein
VSLTAQQRKQAASNGYRLYGRGVLMLLHAEGREYIKYAVPSEFGRVITVNAVFPDEETCSYWRGYLSLLVGEYDPASSYVLFVQEISPPAEDGFCDVMVDASIVSNDAVEAA